MNVRPYHNALTAINSKDDRYQRQAHTARVRGYMVCLFVPAAGVRMAYIRADDLGNERTMC